MNRNGLYTHLLRLLKLNIQTQTHEFVLAIKANIYRNSTFLTDFYDVKFASMFGNVFALAICACIGNMRMKHWYRQWKYVFSDIINHRVQLVSIYQLLWSHFITDRYLLIFIFVSAQADAAHFQDSDRRWQREDTQPNDERVGNKTLNQKGILWGQGKRATTSLARRLVKDSRILCGLKLANMPHHEYYLVTSHWTWTTYHEGTGHRRV